MFIQFAFAVRVGVVHEAFIGCQGITILLPNSLTLRTRRTTRRRRRRSWGWRRRRRRSWRRRRRSWRRGYITPAILGTPTRGINQRGEPLLSWGPMEGRAGLNTSARRYHPGPREAQGVLRFPQPLYHAHQHGEKRNGRVQLGRGGGGGWPLGAPHPQKGTCNQAGCRYIANHKFCVAEFDRTIWTLCLLTQSTPIPRLHYNSSGFFSSSPSAAGSANQWIERSHQQQLQSVSLRPDSSRLIFGHMK